MSDAPTPLVAEVRARLAGLFEGLGVPAERDDAGDFVIPHHVTVVHVMVSEVDGHGVLEIWSPVLEDLDVTPALARFAAETSFLFGRLCLATYGEDQAQLQLSHTMLADPLDEEILVQQLGAIANTAAQLAETQQSTFGGRLSL